MLKVLVGSTSRLPALVGIGRRRAYRSAGAGRCAKAVKDVGTRPPESPTIVMSVNGGNRVVPTVLFDNGTALTNPTIVQIKQRLAATRR